MHIRHAKASYIFWRKTSLVLIFSLSVLVVSQVFLVFKVATKEEKWILVPQLAKQTALSNKYLSKEYLISWSDSLASALLCVTPDIIEKRMGEVLAKTSPAGYGVVSDRLKKEAAELKKHHLSTAFYPSKFAIFEQKNTVEVEGVFHTYFGKDKAPVVEQKTWVLRWDRSPNGLILLADFYEKKEALL